MKRAMQSEAKSSARSKAGHSDVGTGKAKYGFLINKELPQTLEARFEELKARVGENENGGEKILFAVVSDLTLKGTYGDSAIFVTDKRFFVLTEDVFNEYSYGEVISIKVKRMYGNACIYLDSKGGKRRRIFRYT